MSGVLVPGSLLMISYLGQVRLDYGYTSTDLMFTRVSFGRIWGASGIILVAVELRTQLQVVQDFWEQSHGMVRVE